MISRRACVLLTCLAFIAALNCIAKSSLADEALALENEQLRVEFSKTDGTITRLRNKVAGLELISQPPSAPRAWAMLLGPPKLVSDFTSFQFAFDNNTPSTKLHFEWQTPYDITISADAELPADSNGLRLTAAAKNAGERTMLALRYPDIQGIGTLSSDGKNDQLLHSTMMGAIFDDPFHLFAHDGAISQQRGLVVSHYPNGFHGSATQLMAYYEKGVGGFYLAAEDGHATDKDFNFFKATEQSLSCEIAHFNWDARPGKSLELDYPVIIAAMTEGTWYEAAERYREWALRQSWCARGTLHERVEKGDASPWLIEDTGAVGMWWPFRQDIRPQIRRTHELLDTSLLHLELWWQHHDSVAAARQLGDRFGPFYFPNLALKGKSSFDSTQNDAITPLTTVISSDWIAMCSSQSGWQTNFIESAEDMVGHTMPRHHQIWMEENKTGCDADCLYFDIGPCAGIPTHCYATDHQHSPGAGRHITDSHVSLLLESQQRASKAKGAYVPLGTECITEPFLGAYDMYYPRNAGFGLDMEIWPYVRQLTWLPDGKMQTVPLFAFIYHDYSPLSMQGVHSADPWNSPPESEGINTWAEARAYLWGGVMTIAPLDPNLQVSPARERFLRSLAAARTKFAKDYLVYGRMQQPPNFQCETITLDHGLAIGGWLRKLRFESKETAAKAIGLPIEEKKDNPSDAKNSSSADLTVEHWVKEMLELGATPATTKTVDVPSIVCNTYSTTDHRVGVLFVNLHATDSTRLDVPLDRLVTHLTHKNVRLIRHTIDGATDLEYHAGMSSVAIDLPPREVVLLELTPFSGREGDR